MAIRYFHVHNRIQRLAIGLDAPLATLKQSEDSQTLTSSLHQYRWQLTAKVEELKGNLSGIVHMADQKQFLAILNRPNLLIRMNEEGEILGQHRLHGVSDTEDVSYLGHNKVLVVQEKRNAIAIFNLPEQANQDIYIANAQQWQLETEDFNNLGYEGAAYDASEDALYIVKEKSPKKLLHIAAISQLRAGQQPKVSDLSHLLTHVPFLTDLSAIAVSPRTGHLLLLSDESQMIAEINTHGKLINALSLMPTKWHKERLPMPQPEGLTLDDKGQMYVVSEPNYFYRYEKESQS